MNQAVIIDAIRTPIGRFGAALASMSAVNLGTACLQALLERVASEYSTGTSNLHDIIEEVLIGNVLSAGLGQNIARQITLYSKLPKKIPATTLNMVCGSSLKAVILASQLINLGERSTMIAGGTESMSQAPYVIESNRWGKRYGHSQLIDTIVKDGLNDAFHNYPMGITAETIATRWKISRKKQDEFALLSQQKVQKAEQSKLFNDERMSLRYKKNKQDIIIEKDEFPRSDTTIEKLAKLPAAFDNKGTVTAGNASGINDGAAMLLIMSEKLAENSGITPLARIVDSCTIALDEEIMGYSPYWVIKNLLTQNKLRQKDIDHFEINEAFAAQCIAVIQDLHLEPDQVNPLGGAIALGHPIGASGARILTTLAHALRRKTKETKRKARGIAALCVGGGQGCGVLIESI